MKRAELVAALKTVMPGVDTKGSPTITGAEAFIFEKGWLKTFNDNISVSFILDSDVQAAVKADKFYAAVNKMKGEDITLIVDNGLLTAKCGGSTLSAPLLDETPGDKIVENIDLNKIDFYPIPKDFAQGLSLCSMSAAENIAYGILCGICISGKDIVSTDNFRASWYTMKEEMKTFVLPAKAAMDVLNIPDIGFYAVDESWAHFSNDKNVIYSTRLWHNDYPIDKIMNIFPESVDKERKYFFPKELKDAIDRVAAFAYETDNFKTVGGHISFERKGAVLVCKGETEGFMMKDEVPIDPAKFPDKFNIMIPFKQIQSILEKTLEFYIIGNLYFKVDNFQHIISSREA